MLFPSNDGNAIHNIDLMSALLYSHQPIKRHQAGPRPVELNAASPHGLGGYST